jgi:hypothetical protein
VDLEGIPDDTEDIQREWFLNTKCAPGQREVNYATHTEPPMLLLWSKRRASPAA